MWPRANRKLSAEYVPCVTYIHTYLSNMYSDVERFSKHRVRLVFMIYQQIQYSTFIKVEKSHQYVDEIIYLHIVYMQAIEIVTLS